ncbi:uncharacterized protein LOC122298795 [Carya illinoinensis]|uniref:uncharacterized protein LOC122298795 n=1 Tax=Carya illinoinensis TaxID=32201 RepID=UPI001C7210C4|nr:uncharacterized protein LOC122298795 [Carya illinoinensis]
MVSFREILNKCHLYDLGYRGDMFTLSNKYGDGTYTKERLDRVVANPIWTYMFTNYGIEGLVVRSSDHKPLLMRFSKEEEASMNSAQLFKYEAKWNLEDDCGGVVLENWKYGGIHSDPVNKVKGMLENCEGALERWSR